MRDATRADDRPSRQLIWAHRSAIISGCKALDELTVWLTMRPTSSSSLSNILAPPRQRLSPRLPVSATDVRPEAVSSGRVEQLASGALPLRRDAPASGANIAGEITMPKARQVSWWANALALRLTPLSARRQVKRAPIGQLSTGRSAHRLCQATGDGHPSRCPRRVGARRRRNSMMIGGGCRTLVDTIDERAPVRANRTRTVDRSGEWRTALRQIDQIGMTAVLPAGLSDSAASDCS